MMATGRNFLLPLVGLHALDGLMMVGASVQLASVLQFRRGTQYFRWNGQHKIRSSQSKTRLCTALQETLLEIYGLAGAGFELL